MMKFAWNMEAYLTELIMALEEAIANPKTPKTAILYNLDGQRMLVPMPEM
jgi:hypothetical protein